MATTEDLEITALNAMAASPDGAMTLSDMTAHLETRLSSSNEELRAPNRRKARASGTTCGACYRLNKGLAVYSTEGSSRWTTQATWYGSRSRFTTHRTLTPEDVGIQALVKTRHRTANWSPSEQPGAVHD